MTTPLLHFTGGIARYTAVDDHRNTYIQFTVDYLADQEDGTCSNCEETIQEGWLCLDDSSELCTNCVSMCKTPNCLVCEHPRPSDW